MQKHEEKMRESWKTWRKKGYALDEEYLEKEIF